MFKFVVCALFAAAVVADPEPKPGAIIAPYTPYASYAPYAYSSTYLAPAATTVTKTSAGYYNSPYFYSSPYYAHFIKKRSAPFYASQYIAPSTYTFGAYPAHVLTPALSTPVVHSAPVIATYPAAHAHFIKKRSAPLLTYPSTYIAPTTYAATAPVVTSPYSYSGHLTYTAAAPITYPYYSTGPFAYSTFIKK